MTCAHCCGAEQIFDAKGANKQLKKYLKKGPNKTTRMLISALSRENINGLSLLDIGGGVGVIQHELLKKGITQSTDVDASPAYIKSAKEIMAKNEMEDKMEFIHGDFNDVYTSLENKGIVTLERVVCCYPNVVDLINNSTAKADNYYAFIYPMDNLLSRLVNRLGDFHFRLKKSPFRSFVHSEKMMHELVQSNGFERIYHASTFPWKVAVYKRS